MEFEWSESLTEVSITAEHIVSPDTVSKSEETPERKVHIKDLHSVGYNGNPKGYSWSPNPTSKRCGSQHSNIC